MSISGCAGVGRFLVRLVLFGAALLIFRGANAQSSELDAALAQVKITDLSARPCDPKAVWRFDITDPEALNSWRSFLNAVNPIIRNILYSGCDGIQTLVADIQFKGKRIAVTPLSISYDEAPSRYIRDPVLLEKFDAIVIAESKAKDAANKIWYAHQERDREEKARIAWIEAAPLRAEAARKMEIEARKKESEVSQAMQPDGSGLAPYHVRDCHQSAATPRGTHTLTERDICEAIFRSGLAKPEAMIFPKNVDCQVVQKKGAIPLAQCKYDYTTFWDTSKRPKDADPLGDFARAFLSRFSLFSNMGGEGTSFSVKKLGESDYLMPKSFYFDILKKQWEPNGDELTGIYKERLLNKQDADREAYRRAEEEDAKRFCEIHEIKSSFDDCRAKVFDRFHR